MKMKYLAATAMTVALVSVAAPAGAAITLINNGDHGTAVLGLNDGSIAGVTSALKFTLFSHTSTQYVIDFLAGNFTTNGTSRVTSFGFNVDPNFASAALANSPIFTDFEVNGAIGPVGLDFCAFGGSNCNGGAGGGLNTGLITGGRITLNFNPAVGAGGITLSGFTDKYQSVSAFNGGSLRGTEGGGGNPTPFDNGVPEPATWVMMIAGFGGVGALLRRRRALVAA
jgi:hypothetical protein